MSRVVVLERSRVVLHLPVHVERVATRRDRAIRSRNGHLLVLLLRVHLVGRRTLHLRLRRLGLGTWGWTLERLLL